MSKSDQPPQPERRKNAKTTAQSAQLPQVPSAQTLPQGLVGDLLNSPVFGEPTPPTSPTETVPSEEGAGYVPELVAMYPGDAPFLARFLPRSAPQYAGLSNHFCDLHAFLTYLHEQQWHGYLHATLAEQAVYVLLYEGRTVAAATAKATESTSGEQALGDLLALYEQGAVLSAHPLSPTFSHVLSGIGNRAWKFNLTEDFTGLHARPSGAIYYADGKIVATMQATLPYEGAFPAPLRPQTLILPRSLAGWAHHPYSLTLRGRDALNAITDVYLEFRGKYGPTGQALMRALGQNLTPAEYAMREDLALHELETVVAGLVKAGYLRDQ